MIKGADQKEGHGEKTWGDWSARKVLLSKYRGVSPAPQSQQGVVVRV